MKNYIYSGQKKIEQTMAESKNHLY